MCLWAKLQRHEYQYLSSVIEFDYSTAIITFHFIYYENIDPKARLKEGYLVVA